MAAVVEEMFVVVKQVKGYSLVRYCHAATVSLCKISLIQCLKIPAAHQLSWQRHPVAPKSPEVPIEGSPSDQACHDMLDLRLVDSVTSVEN